MNKIRHIPIADGVTLHAVPAPRFKNNRISVNILLPLSRETAAENALLPFLLRRGSRQFSSMQKLQEMLCELYGARLGVNVAKRGDRQVLTLSLQCIASRYTPDGEDVTARCAALLGDLLLSPALQDGAFDAQAVEIEKNNLVDLIESNINDKRLYAMERLVEEMCRDEAYGVCEYGTVEAARAITPQGAAQAWRRAVETGRMEIFATGSLDPAPVAAALQAAFAPVRRAPDPVPAAAQPRPAPAQVREVTDTLPVEQAKLVLGLRTQVAAPADTLPLQLGNTIFGASPHSKLFVNVRERLHLCYYCSASIEKYKGLMFIQCGVEEKNKDAAVQEILSQLERTKQGDFTDEELRAAKLSLSNSYRTIDDALVTLESWYLGQLLCGTEEAPRETAARLEALTREDVVAAMAAVAPDTIYLLKGGDAK